MFIDIKYDQIKVDICDKHVHVNPTIKLVTLIKINA